MTLFTRLMMAATATASFALALPVHAKDKAVALPTTVEAAAPSKIDLEEIDRRIAILMQRDDMVGLSVAIIENGQIISAKGYGETIKGSAQKVTSDTVFRWASVSKGVAAATAILLVKDGYFGLSSPVVAHAPSVKLPPSDYQITLEDLLSHRTGIVRNAFDVKIEDGRDPKVIRTSLEKLSHLCEPGTCHGYQNVLFDAVSEMTETATGVPYKAVVNERIFEPLGMTTASTTLEGLSRSKSWARPHNRGGAMISSVKPTYYRVPAAAGVNSSITDMAKWTLAQMDDGEGGLPTDVAAEIHTSRVKTPRENRSMRRYYSALSDAHYALGWRSYNMDGHRVVGHRGAVEGYRSAVLFDPDHKTGIAMMWNSSSSRPVGLQLELFDQVHGKPRRDWMRLAR